MAKGKNYYRPRKNLVAEQMKGYSKEINDSLPMMYAAIALTLWDCCELGSDDICYLFAYSQKLWKEYAENPTGMLNECKAKTGIDLRRGEDF